MWYIYTYIYNFNLTGSLRSSGSHDITQSVTDCQQTPTMSRANFYERYVFVTSDISMHHAVMEMVLAFIGHLVEDYHLGLAQTFPVNFVTMTVVLVLNLHIQVPRHP